MPNTVKMYLLKLSLAERLQIKAVCDYSGLQCILECVDVIDPEGNETWGGNNKTLEQDVIVTYKIPQYYLDEIVGTTLNNRVQTDLSKLPSELRNKLKTFHKTSFKII